MILCSAGALALSSGWDGVCLPESSFTNSTPGPTHSPPTTDCRTSLTTLTLSNSFWTHVSIRFCACSYSFSLTRCIDDHGSFGNLPIGLGPTQTSLRPKTSTMTISSNSLSRGSGMLHQVEDALLHAMSGTELSRVRPELQLLPPEPINQRLLASRAADIVMQASRSQYTYGRVLSKRSLKSCSFERVPRACGLASNRSDSYVATATNRKDRSASVAT